MKAFQLLISQWFIYCKQFNSLEQRSKTTDCKHEEISFADNNHELITDHPAS